MKKSLFIFLLIALNVSKLFSQDSTSNCHCWMFVTGDITFQVAPITQGPEIEDQGTPPAYYNDDGSTLPIPLPFNFCFYGQSYNTVFINNNGNITFIKPSSDFNKNPFPLGTDTLMIAPFYADIDTYGGTNFPGADRVFYKITPTYMIVKWNMVGFHSPNDNDEFNDFHLIITNGADSILPAGNNVSFCYRTMQWASADTSGGFNGFGGVPATVGINRGNKINYAQFGRFTIPGTQYYGPYAANDGLGWLKYKSFTFNTCGTGNIPPVIINSNPGCDTLTVCDLDTVTITSSFLNAQQGQTSVLSASSPGLTGISILSTNTVNNVSTITVQLVPSVNDTGIHILNIMAADNSSPSQTSVKPVVVIVKACSVGVNEINTNADFSIYPNPTNGMFNVKYLTPNGNSASTIAVYNVIGEQVFTSAINHQPLTIDLKDMPKGIYFLKVYKETISVGVQKIVIE